MQHIDISNVRMDRSDPRNFTHWLLIHAIANNKDPEIKAVWDKLKAEDIPIDFKIAGVEVSFEKALHGIEEQLDRMIEEKAIELFRERCGSLLDELDEFTRNVRAKGNDLFPLARRDD